MFNLGDSWLLGMAVFGPVVLNDPASRAKGKRASVLPHLGGSVVI